MHVHSSLRGMTPQERFFSEPERIRRIAEEKIERSFLLEIDRHVSSDGVISINNVLYEVPYQFADKKVSLRHTPDMKEIYVISGDDLIPITELNKHDNSKAKRKIHLTGGA